MLSPCLFFKITFITTLLLKKIIIPPPPLDESESIQALMIKELELHHANKFSSDPCDPCSSDTGTLLDMFFVLILLILSRFILILLLILKQILKILINIRLDFQKK